MQAAAGFLAQLDGIPDLTTAPFHFSERYQKARELIRKGIRTFTTTSMGLLFNAAAALLGVTRETSFEGQAAIWLEQLAHGVPASVPYAFPFVDLKLDFRPLIASGVRDRLRGRDPAEIARAFQRGVAEGLCDAVTVLSQKASTGTVVLSGGVFQNELLLQNIQSVSAPRHRHLNIWTNHAVPPNDGGTGLRQAALASFGQFD